MTPREASRALAGIVLARQEAESRGGPGAAWVARYRARHSASVARLQLAAPNQLPPGNLAASAARGWRDGNRRFHTMPSWLAPRWLSDALMQTLDRMPQDEGRAFLPSLGDALKGTEDWYAAEGMFWGWCVRPLWMARMGEAAAAAIPDPVPALPGAVAEVAAKLREGRYEAPPSLSAAMAEAAKKGKPRELSLLGAMRRSSRRYKTETAPALSLFAEAGLPPRAAMETFCRAAGEAKSMAAGMLI